MKQIGLTLMRCLFWLALSLYLGGLIALGAIAAPAIFRTVQGIHATAPQFEALTKAGEPEGAARQLGGEIFGNILRRFATLEMICLSLLLVTVLILGYTGLRRGWGQRLGVALVVLLICGYVLDQDLTAIIWRTRSQWREAATQGQVQLATAHRTKFDRLHHCSEQMAHLKVWLLLGLLTAGVIAERNPKS